tara:strand:+ start:1101 stop:2864 length:1764 start_codon:yes stop_codon:yes gene_type:complete
MGIRRKKGYSGQTIAETVEVIRKNELFLPALQRKFVWDTPQIEGLFDSIMQGFPIGTFLLWELNDQTAINSNVFYNFIKHYDTRYSRNQKASLSSKKSIVSVLDGQQRLTSLNIALNGTYTYKTPRKRFDNPEAYPKRVLFLNLLPRTGEDFKYEFKFLPDTDQSNQPDKLWYKVNEVLSWEDASSIDEEYRKLKERAHDKKLVTTNSPVIKKTLRTLYRRIRIDDPLMCFTLKDMGIDDVLDIFIRVNSGGTQLSKTDLLMSTITASWENARDRVEDLLKSINEQGRKFNFDIDFVMRTCLFLLDDPILFRVRSFGPEKINEIKTNWGGIYTAISETVSILNLLGYDGMTLTSRNSVIPIVYHIYKGGDTKTKERNQFKKYLQHALLTGFFGTHGDQALANLRSYLREGSKEDGFKLKRKSFDFDHLKTNLNTPGKTLEITEEDLEDLLQKKKGRQAFVVLSILYPQFEYNTKNFDQDHIHPTYFFSFNHLSSIGKGDKYEEWQTKKDTIPNLQMLEERKNRVKNKREFKDWLDMESEIEKKEYLEDNYIPLDVSYDIKDFDEFYNKRKDLLIIALKKILLGAKDE